jgi:hypothetical protein
MLPRRPIFFQSGLGDTLVAPCFPTRSLLKVQAIVPKGGGAWASGARKGGFLKDGTGPAPRNGGGGEGAKPLPPLGARWSRSARERVHPTRPGAVNGGDAARLWTEKIA